MKRFEAKILDYINEYDMISDNDKVLVGLSGGADSVCLLRILKRIGVELYAVHINHELRGAEADGDEEFCRELCSELNVPFSAYHRDIKAYALEKGLTVEEAGRQVRYDAFRKYAVEKHASKIAVAHNKNDLAETVLFNAARGSGLSGLSGIRPVRDNIIRPLLCVKREEIESYLDELGQSFRTDSTNLLPDYDRNKIRHIILPALCEINSKTIEHISDMAGEAGESYLLVKQLAKEKYEKLALKKNPGLRVEIDINGLLQEHSVIKKIIIHEALADVAGKRKDISRVHINAVERLITGETGKSIELPYDISAKKSYETLIISNQRIKKNEIFYEILYEDLKKRQIIEISQDEKIELYLEDKQDKINIIKNNYTKMADYGKIKGTLCIRTPQKGDYIIIDDKGNSKKLSRLFIDNKTDREKRINWPVVACGNEIIWAVGLRYSEGFKVDETTEKILYLKYEGKGE